jgi:hypothetical protein
MIEPVDALIRQSPGHGREQTGSATSLLCAFCLAVTEYGLESPNIVTGQRQASEPPFPEGGRFFRRPAALTNQASRDIENPYISSRLHYYTASANVHQGQQGLNTCRSNCQATPLSVRLFDGRAIVSHKWAPPGRAISARRSTPWECSPAQDRCKARVLSDAMFGAGLRTEKPHCIFGPRTELCMWIWTMQTGVRP